MKRHRAIAAASSLTLTIGLVAHLLQADTGQKDSNPLPMQSRAPATSRPSDVIGPATDETAVASVIDDLGSEEFAVRKAASERLEQLGPDVVPILEKYREHDNPEVRARINGVINAFAWMSKGAIIGRIEPGGPGVKAGLKMGDVVVKVNNSDIVVHTDVAKAVNEQAENIWFIWRQGQVKQYRIPPGRLGIWMSNWDIAKGGNDQARALAELGKTDANWHEAYRRLCAAKEAGMNDSQTFGVLAGLASRMLDRDLADEAYLRYRATDHNCTLTHSFFRGSLDNNPPSAPHTRWLLEQYREQPFSTDLYHELEDWSLRYGRNRPWLAELLAKPWPDEVHRIEQKRIDDAARLALYTADRAYDKALAVWDNRADRESVARAIYRSALNAAVSSGNIEKAVDIAIGAMSMREEDSAFLPLTTFAALAAACVADDERNATRFLEAFAALPEGRRNKLLTFESTDCLFVPPARARIRRWLDEQPKADSIGPLEVIALADRVADPKSTRAEFDAFVGRYGKASHQSEFAHYEVTGLVRFGDLEKAAVVANRIERIDRDALPAQLVKQLVAARAKYAKELEGPWKAAAAGLIKMFAYPKDQDVWLVRYDGQIFLGQPGKEIVHIPGLPPPPVPLRIDQSTPLGGEGEAAVTFPYGKARTRRTQLSLAGESYVLTEKAGPWLAAGSVEGPIPGGFSTLQAEAARYLDRTYGLPLHGHRRDSLPWMGQYFWFEGNLLIHVHFATRAVTDLSKAIGQAAGRQQPAQIFWPYIQPSGPVLLHTDCGLWQVDRKTQKVQRVPLGLPDENVIVVHLDQEDFAAGPEKSTLVGVAPQHGGQIFWVDKDMKVTATKGFNGSGPLDWFAHQWNRPSDMQPVIYHQFLQRHSKAADAGQ